MDGRAIALLPSHFQQCRAVTENVLRRDRISAGGTQFTIPVPIRPCTSPGPTKTFSITISSVTGPATIQLATGAGTIFNIS